MGDLKQKVVKGAIWTLIEKLSCQAVGFTVGMILARLLTPGDYGTVALTAIFFAVTNVLVDGGFGVALIQKKDADDLDFNSVSCPRSCLIFPPRRGIYFRFSPRAEYVRIVANVSQNRYSRMLALFA